MNTTQRDITLDMMKGLGILLLFINHCYPMPWAVRRISMTFLMPMFFLIGGYLYKPESPTVNIRKSAKRLLLPYLAGTVLVIAVPVWDGVIAPLTGLKMIVSGAGVTQFACRYWSRWESVGAFWFFPAMFWTRVIFNLIYTRTGRFRYCVLPLVALAGYLMLRYVVRLPFGMSEGWSAMLFYLFGHGYRKMKEAMPAYGVSWQRALVWGRRLFVLVSVPMWFWCLANSTIVFGEGYFANHWKDMWAACGMTCIFGMFCRAVAVYLPRMTRLLAFAGGGSLFMLWIHKVSLHYVFVWPAILGYMPEMLSGWWIAAFLGLQWVFCLASLMVASRSSQLKDFFSIYSYC